MRDIFTLIPYWVLKAPLWGNRGAHQAATDTPCDPHNEEPEIRNRILWEGVRFLACRRKPKCPEKTYQGGHGIGKPTLRTTTGKLHW